MTECSHVGVDSTRIVNSFVKSREVVSTLLRVGIARYVDDRLWGLISNPVHRSYTFIHSACEAKLVRRVLAKIVHVGVVWTDVAIDGSRHSRSEHRHVRSLIDIPDGYGGLRAVVRHVNGQKLTI